MPQKVHFARNEVEEALPDDMMRQYRAGDLHGRAGVGVLFCALAEGVVRRFLHHASGDSSVDAVWHSIASLYGQTPNFRKRIALKVKTTTVAQPARQMTNASRDELSWAAEGARARIVDAKIAVMSVIVSMLSVVIGAAPWEAQSKVVAAQCNTSAAASYMVCPPRK
jgi:predicted phage tail protein